MNGWKVLVGVLVVTNFAWLGWGLLESGAGLKQMESSGLRSEWVTIEKPWQQAVEVARSNAPVAPKINLKEGLAQLDSAIESASKQVFEDPKNNQTCLQWGPLLQSESARVADSLSNWGGETDRLERQVPVGYVVFLPQEIVNTGVGIDQLSGKGITDMFYITTPGPLQGTISLGLFRDVERANVQRDDLIKRGVAGVQIRERLGPVRVFFELRGTPDQIKSVQSIFELNSKGELKACGT
ncbi:hypothetical protein EV673_1961 [Limnobacter thiooxidans]|uniref:SPOR domain-containing protein n=1 Tax=Limnobacter thiooxidans TaxID=131080 RepID=A0AA86J0M7_9BURK|nr:hypothetical protein EV673_1961 [Limnobacter thiooxidans]BET27364.1 hypothetical protein RGQ30_28650 [Limnobacter thiooxidans]